MTKPGENSHFVLTGVNKIAIYGSASPLNGTALFLAYANIIRGLNITKLKFTQFD